MTPPWLHKEDWQRELNSRPKRHEYTIHYKADGTVEYIIYLTVDVSDLLPSK